MTEGQASLDRTHSPVEHSMSEEAAGEEKGCLRLVIKIKSLMVRELSGCFWTPSLAAVLRPAPPVRVPAHQAFEGSLGAWVMMIMAGPGHLPGDVGGLRLQIWVDDT